MPRDIAPLRNSLDNIAPGSQPDVYSLLAAWDKSIKAALDRGGGSRFREIMTQYLNNVIDLVDAAATKEGIDWGFLQDCVDAYPPGATDHHCSSVLANVVARCVIRTRTTDGVNEIPVWALDYLAAITYDEDGDWAGESAGAYGWGVGHPDIAVIDRTLELVEAEGDWAALDILQHAAFANPDAAITLLERLLRSSATVEDLEYLRILESVFEQKEQDFPDFPEYWEPQAELEHEVMFTDEQLDRLLAILGETINHDRLRQFNDNFAFDLQRAANED